MTLAADRLQLPAVGDLSQALLARCRRPSAARSNLREHVLGQLARQRPVLDERHQLRQRGGRYREVRVAQPAASSRAPSTSLMTQFAARSRARPPHRGVVVGGDLALGHQHARVLRRQADRPGVAGEAILGQLGQASERRQRGVVDDDRRQVRLGK